MSILFEVVEEKRKPRSEQSATQLLGLTIKKSEASRKGKNQGRARFGSLCLTVEVAKCRGRGRLNRGIRKRKVHEARGEARL